MKSYTCLLHLFNALLAVASIREKRRRLEHRQTMVSINKGIASRGGLSGQRYREQATGGKPEKAPLASIADLVFDGAFRLHDGTAFGVSDINYAVGALAHNPNRKSLLIVGHAAQSAVAEYAIVDVGGSTSTTIRVADLPQTGPPLQGFVPLLTKVPDNPEELDRITGMLVLNDTLYVNAETWYDAGADNQDTSLYVSNVNDLSGSSTVGLFQLVGGAQSAGYMGEIPIEFQSLFGGAQYYTGWSSVYSIISRYSLGPSFWTFAPSDMKRSSLSGDPIPAKPWVNYAYSNNDPTKWLSPRATEWAAQDTPGPFAPADALWNPLSNAVYSFFIPSSRTWCVIGSTGGLSSGMGYKAVQSNGFECPGPCPYDPDDWYNYYWLYDVEVMASAANPWEARPYAYGQWDLPYVTIPEQHRVIGGTIGDGKLYVALANAAKVGEYDQPPLILTFRLTASAVPAAPPTSPPTTPRTTSPTPVPTPSPTKQSTSPPTTVRPITQPSPLPTPTRASVPPTIPPTPVPTVSTSLGRASIDILKYKGAFRLLDGTFGASDINYAIGTLAYNPDRQSLFIVGHAHQSAIAEYAIVPPGISESVADLPQTGRPLQGFLTLLDKVDNPEGLDRITGMMVVDGSLYVNAELWYDAGASNRDTSLYVSLANDIGGSATVGLFELTGGARSAGYMGEIPAELRSLFGGAEYYTGWSSVYSGLARYSLGPSFWTFAPSDMLQSSPGARVEATAWVDYGFSGGDSSKWLSPRAAEWGEQGTPGPFAPADTLWNPMSRGMYSFFIPNSRTWCVIGSTGGLTSGIGYKAVQSNGNLCGGPCPYDPDDWYNYFWLYDAEEMASAGNVWEVRPYSYGELELPYVRIPASHLIIGGTIGDGILYIALASAGKVDEYDEPPLILTYQLPSLSRS